MTEKDRPFLVEMAIMITGCSREYCQKMCLKESEFYYLGFLEEGAE